MSDQPETYQSSNQNFNSTQNSVQPLWTPSDDRIEASVMTAFIRKVNAVHSKSFVSYEELYAWSISEPEKFWHTVSTFFSLRFHQEPSTIMVKDKVFQQTKWFADAKLNFAENLLLTNQDNVDLKKHVALVEINELGNRTELTYSNLCDEVSCWVQALENVGVQPGDRVAGYLPNISQTVIAMLATTALGGVWSSCSPDFGEQGIKDRFSQINPTVIITTDGYTYKGKPFVTVEKLAKLLNDLYSNSSVKPNLKKIIVVPYLLKNQFIETIPNIFPVDINTLSQEEKKHLVIDSESFLDKYSPTSIKYVSRNFSDPLYILYSSGTTGIPKCLMHGIGNTLIQHVKELGLHTDVKSSDKIFFFTTCGWMMWNWLVSSLFFKVTIVLYEGNPFHPCFDTLLDMVDQEGITIFGSGAQYYNELMKFMMNNRTNSNQPDHRTRTLRTVLSTGSPLTKNGFNFIYERINRNVQLSSISGGTDIVSCFVLGSPILPVYTGEIQCRGLGMAVEVFDENQKSVVGKKGELVCTVPFPAMPVGFYADLDGSKYHNAYFDTIPNVWCHGDYAEITPRGGVIIYGRSDTTLNPGGVRIGTAEIYRSIETLSEIVQTAAIGYEQDEDIKIMLMVKLAEGVNISISEQKSFCELIRRTVREQSTPRHVPTYIVRVPDIPCTISGKISEKAISDIINRREQRKTKNIGALSNPECLDFYRQLSKTTIKNDNWF